MKFPRNAKILRSHFDVAPFAAVFFLLLIFLMLAGLMPIAGIPLNSSIQPPEAANLPGTDQPTIAIAVDAQDNLYYENQLVTKQVLVNGLKVATNAAHAPLTLVINLDKAVSYQTFVDLSLLARDYGITNVLLATLPRLEVAAPQP